jgi:hypothetical protein
MRQANFLARKGVRVLANALVDTATAVVRCNKFGAKRREKSQGSKPKFILMYSMCCCAQWCGATISES